MARVTNINLLDTNRPIEMFKDGTAMNVTNLGYILRRAAKDPVVKIIVQASERKKTVRLVVILLSGGHHLSGWADVNVLIDWLHARRSWHGATIHVVSTEEDGHEWQFSGELSKEFPTHKPVFKARN